ncbi:MAG: RluA family pseudouridine synthase [Deltaproteobacteria bacterium]|nr:RluA family pseudouridine synthase [Deltaproteobacteria bacterium]
MNDSPNRMTFTATEKETGERVDVFLSGKLGGTARSQVKRAAEEGRVFVHDRSVKPARQLKAGDVVAIILEPPREDRCQPESLPLDVLYEDTAIIVVNKPPGMVVHPAAGNYRGTLVNALLFHCKDLSGVGGVLRPGIVHRLDKDTSGLIVAAKTDESHRLLAKQFEERRVVKKYSALVIGNVKQPEGVIDSSIGRHPRSRKMMSAGGVRGRSAVTHWTLVEDLTWAALLSVRIMTGRTHQIRVHLNSIGCPVVGDALYGNAGRRIRDIRAQEPRRILMAIKRQALHAGFLSFRHPSSGDAMEFHAELPRDMAEIIACLRDLASNDEEY